ncbi:MAG: alpha/beta hydrolase domain-containing protein [Candidatus Binatia bacterium]
MKLNQHILLTLTLTLLLNSPNLLWGQTSSSHPVTSSGKEFMVPKKEVNGKLIGQEDVLIQEVVISDSGHQYRRLDVGVSGTLEGWALKEQLPMPQLVSAPEFVLIQGGHVGPRFHGTLRYEASKGMGMTLIYPEIEATWNRKLFITVHGAGGSFNQGTMKPWNEILDQSQPLGDISKYERLMLDKGYAVAKTKRNAALLSGDYSVVLDDGEILTGKNVGKQPVLLVGFAQLAENILEARLGQKPVRTYWYGHSGGGLNGRLVNYLQGNNIGADGQPVIDGFINDDSGEGLFLPIVEKDGQDTLLLTEQERQRFVKTIEIAHLLYGDVPGNTHRRDNANLPSWVAPVRIINKRNNARILRDKGLGNKTRTYEVRGVSHSGDEYLAEGASGDISISKLSRLMDGLIDVLDNWVENGVAPPPTKSDWMELGDVNSDGVNENQAIALPDVACPRGLYYPYPASREGGGIGTTGFAAFDGKSLEPYDGRGIFVDMNLNRYLDYRESLEQAWHRLGLLKPDERFTRSTYRACVEDAVAKLQSENFISARVAAMYIEEAEKDPLPGL